MALEDGKQEKPEIGQSKGKSNLDEKQEVKVKDTQKPRLFDLIIDHFAGYSEVSSLHGVSYIADRTRHLIERCFTNTKIKSSSREVIFNEFSGSFGLS